MLIIPWIISGVLAISLAYMIWLYRKGSTSVTKTEAQYIKSMDIDTINSVVKSAFSPYGVDIENKVTDNKSLEANLFDCILRLKEKTEDVKYVETLSRLEPILHDLEALACAKWAPKEVHDFLANTMQLIEHTLDIKRIDVGSIDHLHKSKYWANFEPYEAGLVEKRYSPWVYGEDIIIQGVLQRRQDATE